MAFSANYIRESGEHSGRQALWQFRVFYRSVRSHE